MARVVVPVPVCLVPCSTRAVVPGGVDLAPPVRVSVCCRLAGCLPIYVTLWRQPRARVLMPVRWRCATALANPGRARAALPSTQHPVKILQINARHVDCDAVAYEAVNLVLC